ncbi:MAG: Tim44/TimA family putative adaptor protein [Alphaproteobacteria bacterium]|nr:Tim44/TimA family putative adaptor protein [Alphaproteobacteria bacterium]
MQGASTTSLMARGEMGNGFPFDILLFAMIAAFVALRLYSVLGRRTGNERRPEDVYRRTPTEAQPAPARDTADVDIPPSEAVETVDVAADSDLGRTLSRIMVADRQFNPQQFVQGAKGAYEMIIEGFARGDREALGPLLSDDVYADFESAISDREQAGETMTTRIVDIDRADIEDARLEGSTAEITVRFQSEVSSVIRNADGRIIEGNPSDTEFISDVWTFARDTSSSDPNWLLVETEREDDAA